MAIGVGLRHASLGFPDRRKIFGGEGKRSFLSTFRGAIAMFQMTTKTVQKKRRESFCRTYPSQIPIHLVSFLSHLPTYRTLCPLTVPDHPSQPRLCRSLVFLYTDYHLMRESVGTHVCTCPCRRRGRRVLDGRPPGVRDTRWGRCAGRPRRRAEPPAPNSV